MGPSTENVNLPSSTGQEGTRPGDGLSPTTLQKLAGLRSEPPMSLPSAMGMKPQAKAVAAPPLLPPLLLVRSYGFRVAPNTLLNVCDPAPNSGTFVFPIVIAPAPLRRSTTRESALGTKSL